MGVVRDESEITNAQEALAERDWSRSREAFERAVAETRSGAAFEGLSRALWWRGEAQAAIDARRSAYAAYRRERNTSQAARSACWLAQEYDTLLGHQGAAQGWLRRAERLLESEPAGSAHGWLALTRARTSAAPRLRERYARQALDVAQRFNERDLELLAIAQLGLALVQTGRIDDGVASFHECLAAATSGEAERIETVAEVYCDTLQATELIGQADPFAQWGEVIMAFIESQHMPFIAFCAACCGELLIDEGHWKEAESQLLAGIVMLEASGHRPRCVHPVTTLATLRIVQGRLEDADELLRPYAKTREALVPRARLALAKGRASAARTWLAHELELVGADNLGSAPIQSLLMEAQLQCGDVAAAGNVAEGLSRLAELVGTKRMIAVATLGEARVACATGRDQAGALLAKAAALLADCGMRFEAARARMEHARFIADQDRGLAAEEATEALATFDELGAARESDAAHQFLRGIGAPARTGPKGAGFLSEREREVLTLLAAGLTNAEIAKRLFISPKTAGHHVGRILSKLGFRTRTEAAAFSASLPKTSDAGT
jgi:DNA-binding NarL/FixJ family response regulator/tetratricopeptide (TPR) repeat protein